MAVSNRDRVGRGFEALALGLAPYVDQRMRAASNFGEPSSSCTTIASATSW